MPITPAGNEWLKAHYRLTNFSFTHSSYIGSSHSIELTSKGNVLEVYGIKYAPSNDSPLKHLEFSLKYDDLNLDFLSTVFMYIPRAEIEGFIEASPSGKYARKIGFFYEFLTNNQLRLKKPVSGNYADLLEPEKYITGNTVKNARWRLNNNLLGTRDYSPIVRKTSRLELLLQKDIRQEIEQLKQNYPVHIFNRAISFLYKKETRSSYEIEKEQPSAGRMERFMALLSKAGTEKSEEILLPERLTVLQNAIVDPRFAANGFRDFQNFVGESLPNFQSLVHYVCPQPQILPSLMAGMVAMASKTAGADARIRAALIAFGFVFIHPFEDGNGRLHRFLIHDILVHDGVVPDGFIIPVSAHMLNNIREYDQILEAYSKPLMQRVKYNTDDNGGVTMLNADEVGSYFRYPDLTEQCAYLIKTIHATLQQDMPDELLFIQRYDEAKKGVQDIVDMPDKDIDNMLLFLHQNKGFFPKRRRVLFAKLTDDEILRMQTVYREIFEIEAMTSDE